jgi:hypothetical protein
MRRMRQMTNRREEIKKENKKSFKKFIAIIVVAGIFGGFLGGFSTVLEAHVIEFVGNIAKMLPQISCYLMIGGGLLFHLFGWSSYLKCKKLKESWDGEEEELPELIDKKMGYAMWGMTVNTILNFFSFSIGLSRGFEGAHLGILLSGFLINIFLIILLQQKMVDLLKELNPEKKGSIYDVKFEKRWMESCDEAQKMQIYHAAWESYRIMNVAYVFAWMITYMANLFFGADIFATVVVAALWMVQSSVYCYKSIKE